MLKIYQNTTNQGNDIELKSLSLGGRDRKYGPNGELMLSLFLRQVPKGGIKTSWTYRGNCVVVTKADNPQREIIIYLIMFRT